jgi:indolepyruvate ferredoxin oxidoreductase, beta subunit
MKKQKEQFNIIIAGIGGQGLISLGRMIALAGFLEGKEIRMSELHGLSQRGGSVTVQIRIGKNIYSPLVPREQADLVLALEYSEALKAGYFASKQRTIFLINDLMIQAPCFAGQKLPSLKKVFKELQPFAKQIYLNESSKAVKEKLGVEVLAGTYLVSGAIFSGLLPLKPESFLRALKELLGEKFAINKKAYELAKRDFSLS